MGYDGDIAEIKDMLAGHEKARAAYLAAERRMSSARSKASSYGAWENPPPNDRMARERWEREKKDVEKELADAEREFKRARDLDNRGDNGWDPASKACRALADTVDRGHREWLRVTPATEGLDRNWHPDLPGCHAWQTAYYYGSPYYRFVLDSGHDAFQREMYAWATGARQRPQKAAPEPSSTTAGAATKSDRPQKAAPEPGSTTAGAVAKSDAGARPSDNECGRNYGERVRNDYACIHDSMPVLLTLGSAPVPEEIKREYKEWWEMWREAYNMVRDGITAAGEEAASKARMAVAHLAPADVTITSITTETAGNEAVRKCYAEFCEPLVKKMSEALKTYYETRAQEFLARMLKGRVDKLHKGLHAKLGQVFTLRAKTDPPFVNPGRIIWTSSNPEVAAVNDKWNTLPYPSDVVGSRLTAVDHGDATITATLECNGASAAIDVAAMDVQPAFELLEPTAPDASSN
jgi:hypothetical protein